MNTQVNKMTAMQTEKLYLPMVGDDLPPQTRTAIFLCQYCGYDSFDVVFVQMATSETFDQDGEDLTLTNETKLSTLNPQNSCVGLGHNAEESSIEKKKAVEVPSAGQAKAVKVPSIGQAMAGKVPSGGHAKAVNRFPVESTGNMFGHCSEAPSGCDSKEFEREQLDQEMVAKLSRVTLKPKRSPIDIEFTLKQVKDVDWPVQQCQLPAIVGSGTQRLTCYSGLCAVLRRIVQKGYQHQPHKNLDALLGFRQSALKKGSEVSPLTKLCEIDIYQDMSVGDALPGGILQFENRLASAPVLSSKFTKPIGKKKHKVKTGISQDNTTRPESVFHTETLHLLDKRKVKSAKQLHKESIGQRDQVDRHPGKADCSRDRLFQSTQTGSTSHVNASTPECVDGNSIPAVTQELSLETESTRDSPCGQTDKSRLKTSATQHLPLQNSTTQAATNWEHRFAEGPYVTLTDFALFHCIHSYLQGCVGEGKGRELTRAIPLVLRWYQRMWEVPNVRDCAEKCGLNEVLFSDGLRQVNHTAAEGTDNKTKENLTGLKNNEQPGVQSHLADIRESLEAFGIQVIVEDFPCVDIHLPWDTFPAHVNPSQDVSEDRARHKREQIESLVAAVKTLSKPGDIIVDFCSGGGHVGIVLAHCLPDCHIVMVESNEESMKRAETRIRGTRLDNMTLFQCNLNYYTGVFDVGVALHACGVATDLVLEKCLESKASFVCSPCCYGSARDSHRIQYPRSRRFRSSPLTYKDHLLVGHTAEQTSRNFETEMAKQAKVCMSILDTDRAEAAREQGYEVHLCSLSPPTCSPKNNLLIGKPPL